jgi:acid phosphatase
MARLRLDEALGEPNWSAAPEQSGDYRNLPPAVILDIDETVLDNSPGQARQVMAGTGFVPAQWDAWVRQAKADAIPGAVEFCRYAAARNVAVFFITNREQEHEEATRANLARLGFPLHGAEDAVLSRSENGWGSEKAPRRRVIAARHRVLLLVGDDLGDFLPDIRTTVERRHAAAAPFEEFWGRKWILLSNPSYGSWEQALLDGSASTNGAGRIQVLERRLDPRN